MKNYNVAIVSHLELSSTKGSDASSFFGSTAIEGASVNPTRNGVDIAIPTRLFIHPALGFWDQHITIASVVVFASGPVWVVLGNGHFQQP